MVAMVIHYDRHYKRMNSGTLLDLTDIKFSERLQVQKKYILCDPIYIKFKNRQTQSL